MEKYSNEIGELFDLLEGTVSIDVKVESFIHDKMFHSITYIVSTCDPILRLIMTDAEHIKAKLGHKLI